VLNIKKVISKVSMFPKKIDRVIFIAHLDARTCMAQPEMQSHKCHLDPKVQNTAIIRQIHIN
jgi:hypothetical protein